jgi:hypothetical protein
VLGQDQQQQMIKRRASGAEENQHKHSNTAWSGCNTDAARQSPEQATRTGQIQTGRQLIWCEGVSEARGGSVFPRCHPC